MKQFFIVLFFWIYFFFLLGLYLHSSPVNNHVFGKYSYGYFALLVVLTLLFIPYFKFIKYLTVTSTYAPRGSRIKLTPKRKFLLTGLVVLLLLVPTEIYLRINGYYSIHQSAAGLGINEFDAYLQNKLVPDAVAHNNAAGMQFHIDSYGFRSDEVSRVKPKDVYRIAVLGGSTAFEVFVSYNDSAPKQLQDMLSKHYHRRIEVLNAGVSGYNSENSLIDYQTRVSDFNPDLVIMWHGINDMLVSCPSYPNILQENYQPDYSSYIGPLYNMLQFYYYPPIVSINLNVLNLIARGLNHEYSDLKLYDVISNLIGDYRLAHSIEVNMQWPSLTSYKRNLKYFITAVHSNNTKLILGDQPNMISTWAKYHPEASKGTLVCYNGKTRASLSSQAQGIAEFNAATKQVAQDNDVPFVNLDSVLPRSPEYFLDTYHWSPKGQTLIAQALYKFIVTGNYIPQQ